MTKEPQPQAIADFLSHELEMDAERIAEQLGPEIQAAGAKDVGKVQYHQWIQDMWFRGGAGWRLQLLEQIGPKHFWNDVHEAWGLPVPHVTEEMVGGLPDAGG